MLLMLCRVLFWPPALPQALQTLTSATCLFCLYLSYRVFKISFLLVFLSCLYMYCI